MEKENNQKTDQQDTDTEKNQEGQESANNDSANSQPDNPQEPQDVDNEKALAVIAYIGILWIVPLIAAQDSDFAMYHANQGLNLFIAAMIIFAIGLIPILGWLIAMFGWIGVVIFMIIGIVNAAGGKKKPLPVIGKYKLLE